jgi:hypothetical protein
MTQVVVTDKSSTVVVADPSNTRVITAGLMPPSIVSSITNSVDIDTTQLQDGGVLVYNSTTQKWTATNTFEKQIFEAGQF